MTTDFFTLTPLRVLSAVEQAGHATTGLCYSLNSFENRVYEVELEDRRRVVAKFYRPGRWSRETILDEHRLLAALEAAEIPTCAPMTFPDGASLHATPEGIWFALFPRIGGRSPDELTVDDYVQLGRLIARIHNVSASASLGHRPVLSPRTYGLDSLELILSKAQMSSVVKERYAQAILRIVALGDELWRETETIVTHGDCHRGNLLRGRNGWLFLDFDDSAWAPAVQDAWLLLPSRPRDCPLELDALLAGYEEFRRFDRRSLRLIEVLRALRYVRYAAWILSRWDDPAFPRAFPQFGTEVYWEAGLRDLMEQVGQIEMG